MIELHKIEQADLWYIIGYIVTDGCLSEDKRHIDITSKDKEHLEKIKNVLGLKIKVGKKNGSFRKERVYYRLQFGDVLSYRFLLNIGVIPNKSLLLTSIKVDTTYFGDFLRGVIDGDGNISTWIHKSSGSQQWCLRIYTASHFFSKWLFTEIEKQFNVYGKLYAVTNGEDITFRLKYGKRAAKVLFNEIYYPECLTLDRKFQKARECLEDRN